MILHRFLITLALLTIITQTTKATDPETRCTAAILATPNPFVCNDCLHQYDCNTKDIIACPVTPSPEICDMDFGDGYCQPPAASQCKCDAVGCTVDPTNPDVNSNCLEVDLPPAPLPTCTATQTIDATTCECIEIPCLPCGLSPIDQSSCPGSYLDCNDGDKEYLCPVGWCFVSDDCACRDIGVESCPGCGYRIDGTDGISYCYCAQPNEICGMQCVDGKIFDEATCLCVLNTGPASPLSTPEPTTDLTSTTPMPEPSTTTTPAPEPSTTTTPKPEPSTTTPPGGGPGGQNCDSCELKKGSPTDCSEYFECDAATGATTAGPYHCPGELCYNDCACVTAAVQTTPSSGTGGNCDSCGLSKGSGSDCAEYYECNTSTGENTVGPYYCPGNLCYENCTCV